MALVELFTEYWILWSFLLIFLIAIALPGSKSRADQIDSYEFPASDPDWEPVAVGNTP